VYFFYLDMEVLHFWEVFIYGGILFLEVIPRGYFKMIIRVCFRRNTSGGISGRKF